MIKTVHKGRHRFLPSFPYPILRDRVSRTVMFTQSCAYDLGDENQQDWNKLFGIGFWPGHHTHSYRFAWRYDKEFDAIEIGAYWYDKGVRHSQTMGFVRLYKKVIMTIEYIKFTGEVKFSFCNKGFRAEGRWPIIGYYLGAWFGGNVAAPGKMYLEVG